MVGGLTTGDLYTFKYSEFILVILIFLVLKLF